MGVNDRGPFFRAGPNKIKSEWLGSSYENLKLDSLDQLTNVINLLRKPWQVYFPVVELGLNDKPSFGGL